MVVCKICKSKFVHRGLAIHIIQIHNITPEQYYIEFYKDIGLCSNKRCSNLTKFNGISKGYTRHCSISCGVKSKNIKPYIGRRFGRLVVESFIYDNKRLKFKCRCDCGIFIYIPKSRLKSRATRSCGCLQKDLISSRNKARTLLPIEYVFDKAKRCAKIRDLKFNLDIKEFKSTVAKECFYCGALPYKKYKTLLYNGIDRVDNNKGYILGNCVACCKQCNYAKRDMTRQEFINLVTKIYDRHREKRNEMALRQYNIDLEAW